MTVQAQLPARGGFAAQKTWSLVTIFAWAQVPEPGRDADEVTGSRDFNRPFPVSGTLSDAALAGALAAVRQSPPLPLPPGWPSGQPIAVNALRVQGEWPVARVSGRKDGSVDVRLRVNQQESGGQHVRVQQRDGTWEITPAGMYVHGE